MTCSGEIAQFVFFLSTADHDEEYFIGEGRNYGSGAIRADQIAMLPGVYRVQDGLLLPIQSQQADNAGGAD
jgi:hypothetical protein